MLTRSAEEIIRPARARHIFHALSQKGGKTPKFHWPLSDTFKRGLRNALTGLLVATALVQVAQLTFRGASNSFGVPSEGGHGQVPSIDDLVNYGEDSWEVRLSFDVADPRPSSSTWCLQAST